jgi:hypothetical protein
MSERGKLIILFILLAMSQSLLFACATNPAAVDLTNYVNQGVLQIAELEQKSLERYAAVTGPNYKSDEEVYEALKDWVIPLYSRFLRGLRKIRPETREVRELNRIYIHGAESLLDGFKTLMIAIEIKDPSLINAVNEKLEKGRLENQRWRRELTALSDKYGLKPAEGEGYTESIMKFLLGAGARQM